MMMMMEMTRGIINDALLSLYMHTYLKREEEEMSDNRVKTETNNSVQVMMMHWLSEPKERIDSKLLSKLIRDWSMEGKAGECAEI